MKLFRGYLRKVGRKSNSSFKRILTAFRQLPNPAHGECLTPHTHLHTKNGLNYRAALRMDTEDLSPSKLGTKE